MKLILRVVMLLALGLVWLGAGEVVIQVTGMTDLMPAWQMACLWLLFAGSFVVAGLKLIDALSRSERRAAELERQEGGAWLADMAEAVRKVQS
jgi:hypothetical protein